jgi:hypothetical protein
MDEAMRPIITPLLPVKGLRRDASGNLTADAIKTVLDGVKALGVAPDSESARDAMLQEARYSLCRFYAQYDFLLKSYAVAIARAETPDLSVNSALMEKLQAMQDILSVSRAVLAMPGSPKEGFQVQRTTATAEAFQNIQKQIEHERQRLKSKKKFDLGERALYAVQEKNTYASRQMGLYAMMNIVAVGLLFYIMSM